MIIHLLVSNIDFNADYIHTWVGLLIKLQHLQKRCQLPVHLLKYLPI